MSEMDDEDFVATLKINGVNPTERQEVLGLLEHWKNVYKIPLYEVDKVKRFLEK